MKTAITLNHKTILVTGAAGFIGYYLVKRLLTETEGSTIVGIDNFNDYYDVSLKEWRYRSLAETKANGGSTLIFERGSLEDKAFIDRLFIERRPDVVVNLAAQAGVRYSIDHPDAYINSNLIGFYNILEACRHSYDAVTDRDAAQDVQDTYRGVQHLVYASSSSVYGGNTKVPFSEDDAVDHPISLYAATKKANELLAHSYAKLYDIPCTGLRFFTVYGPVGRPDMALFSFADTLTRGEKIQVFNYGDCKRDFTYVDDIVEGVLRVMCGAPPRGKGSDGLPVPPYCIYNIGNNHPENLMDFVHILAEELVSAGVLPDDFDIEAHINLVPMQPGDVPVTYADTSKLERDFGFKPSTNLRDGVKKFAAWYREWRAT